MIEIIPKSITCNDAKLLLRELNSVLASITGADGTTHFQQNDVEQPRSVFLIAYIDGVPYGCGVLREINEESAEVKRVYARKNTHRLGQLIVQALEQEAVRYNYSNIFLETRIQNEHAIRFYEKCGYVHCPNYGVYKDNKNAYCFTKLIQ